MTRRFFVRAAASALTALTAVRVLPVSMLPRSGAVHEELRLTAIERLRRACAEAIRRGLSIRGFVVGRALISQYEDEVGGFVRMSDRHEFGYYDTTFKGWPLYDELGRHRVGPWDVAVMVDKPEGASFYDGYAAAKRGEIWV